MTFYSKSCLKEKKTKKKLETEKGNFSLCFMPVKFLSNQFRFIHDTLQSGQDLMFWHMVLGGLGEN